MAKKAGAVSSAEWNQAGDEEAAEATLDDRGTSGNGLVRVTVNLNRHAMQALEQLSAASGHTRTETINRALQIHAIVDEIMKRDGGSLYVRHLDGELERITLI